MRAVAIELDGVLGDTRPLWRDWLEDAARRFRSIAPLDPGALPEDRGAAAEELDRWAAVIFAFSAVPDLGTGLGGWDLVLRKLAHATEYAILGALLLRALGRELPAFLAGVAYAVTDEVHQHFVEGRHASPIDVGLDGIGVAAGIYLLRLWQTRPVSDARQVQ